MRHERPICKSNISKVKPYANGSKIIFEIGAYDGVDIEEIKNVFGDDCIVHAFEPDPEVFFKLRKYNESHGVICNNIALSNYSGYAKFVKCWDPSIEDQSNRSLWHKTIQSLMHNTQQHIMSRNVREEEINVPVTTINEYCKINNIHPDILLLDTQGSEWEILDGASMYLNNIKSVMSEWSTKELYEGQKMLEDIVSLLKKYDFHMVEKINLWDDFHGDAIFAK